MVGREERQLTEATPQACSKLITPAAAACVAQGMGNVVQDTAHRTLLYICLFVLCKGYESLLSAPFNSFISFT